MVGSVTHAGAWTYATTAQAVHFVVALAALWSLRGQVSAWRAAVTTQVMVLISASAIVIVGELALDMPRILASLAVTALAVAVCMPWGARGQVVSVASIITAGAVGAVVSERLPVSAFEAFAVLGVFAATVYMARILELQRRALSSEQAAVRAHAAALERSEVVFRSMFEGSSHGMARFAGDQTVLEANDALARMVGESRDDLIGRRLRDVLGDLDFSEEVLDELASGVRADYRAEHVFTGSGGDEVWTQVILNHLRSRDETVTFVVSLHDLTARKRVEQQLEAAKRAAEQAAEAKGRFLAVMSHEIRTPLNAVLGYNELLGETQLNEDQRYYVGTIEQSGRHLSSLIEDILDFSRVDAGKLELDRADVDLRAVLSETVAMFANQTRSKGISLTLDVAQDVPQLVVGDSKRLRQIATNLIGNAVKFTSTGGIEVALRALKGRKRHKLALRVTDTGIGIPKEEQSRLFDAFAQANRSVASKFGGTGLGLAIVKQLAEAMSGGVTVESVPGKGTTFEVVLKLSASKRVPRPAAPDSIDESITADPLTADPNGLPLAGLTVLVAEEDAVSRVLTARLLSELGCLCTTVANGREALDAIVDQHPAVALLDLDMPVLDGVETARRVRDEIPPDRQPVVLAIDAGGGAEASRWREAGIQACLHKPLGTERVTEAVLEALGRERESARMPEVTPSVSA